MSVITHLAELVAIDSTSSRPNAPVVDYLEAILRGHGFDTERYKYLDDRGVEKLNLVARAGPDAAEKELAALALVGHTDCVPFDPDWAGALVLTERDGRYEGRGACDTKGFIACALDAAAHVSLRSLTKPLALIFTGDEETGCVGAKKLAERAPVRPRYAIVGEPTSLRPIRAHKGYFLAEIEVLGHEGHSAYPEVGVSAIAVAGKLLGAIEEIAAGLRAKVNPAFDPPYTTTNVGVIQGGKAKNIIAGSCKLVLEWRPIPGQPEAWVEERLREAAARLVAEQPRAQIRIGVHRQDSGLSTPAASELVAFLEAESGVPAGTVSFGTEGPQLQAMGAEAVVFGPGDITVAHRTGELVSAADLERCREILVRAIRRFCA